MNKMNYSYFYRAIIVLFFVIGSNTLYAVNLIVSGISSPAGANGTYIPNSSPATLNGKNVWVHSSGGYYIYNDIYQSVNPDQPYWYIDVDLSDQNGNDVLFYSNDNHTADSPTSVTSWSAGGGGGSGTPVITESATPEINVKGNGNTISDGSSFPSFTNHTNFGSVNITSTTTTRTYSIENMGSATLNINSVNISGTNSSDYSVTTSPASSVSASGSTTFVITFNPSAEGIRSASISIGNNDSDENPYNFDIQGWGYTPKDLTVSGIATPSANGAYIHQGVSNNYEYWKHNTSNYYIYNDGSNWLIDTDQAPASVLFYSSDHSSDPVPLNVVTWTIQNGTGTPVLAYASATADINLKGNSINIEDGDATPVLTDHTDFGSIEIASATKTRTFTIENTGGALLTLSGTTPYVTISGADASDFSVTTPPTSTIAAYGSTTFVVTFNPSTEGVKTATLTINSDDSDEAIYNFDIKGNGYSVKNLLVSGITNPTAVNGKYIHQGTFSDFQYWKHETQNYYIFNDDEGSRFWNIDVDQVDSDSDYLYYKSSDVYTPVGLTSWTANSGITGSPNIVYSGPEMDVVGNSTSIADGDATPSATDHTDFGSVAAASGSIVRTFTIQNTGTESLSLTGSSPYVSISGTHAADYSVTTIPPSSIAVSGSTTFQITFDPSGKGTRTASLSIDNSDSDENPYNFDIQGTGSNTAPAISGLTSDISVTEDLLSYVDLSAATFSDVDGDALTVTLTTSAGTFTSSTGGSVTVSGSGTSTLTLSGTAANINTFLDTPSNFRYTGALNQNGDNAATFTVNANDGTTNPLLGTVNLDISAVNDDPSISGLPSDITVLEDVASNVDLSAVTFADVDAGANNVVLTITAGTGTLAASTGGSVTIGGSGTGVLTLTGTASNIDTYLNTASNIKYTGTLNTNGNDATTLSIKANDGGNTGTGGGGDVTFGTVNVDITAVNDEPSFTIGSNRTLAQNAGAQSIIDFITDINDGDSEVSQTVSFNVSNNNTTIFTSQPAIGSTGTLTFTPDETKFGKATVTVSISDDGGTDNGGDNQSPEQTFKIFVTPLGITINELNSTPSAEEFVELYNNNGSTLNMNGLVLVFFNGEGDATYKTSIDLDGYTISSKDFFVVGDAGVRNLDLGWNSTDIQNGPDAVALFVGDKADFTATPSTLATSDGLIDAIVYGASDDAVLRATLGDVPLYNENANGLNATESLSRKLDGTGDFVAQTATPGTTNDIDPPTVSNVNSSTANGAYKVGDAISIMVNFTEAVTITGTPQLTLETGTTDEVVNYASGTGTSMLIFSYTVQAGDVSSDLDYLSTSALALNEGTIKDAAGNNATLTLAAPGALNSLGNNKALVVDGIAPTVSNVSSFTANGVYKVGDAISIQVNFTEAVTVTGTPLLTLETGTTDEVVNYASGTGTSTLIFSYTVQTGDVSSDLDYLSTSALALNEGTIKDAAGNDATLTLAAPGDLNSLGDNKALVVDGIAPTVSNVTSTKTNGTYGIDEVIVVTVTFSEVVNVTNTPQLELETGPVDRTINYTSGTGSSTLSFTYTTQGGDETTGLDYKATGSLTLNDGTIADAAGNNATLTLPTPGEANSLGDNKSLVIQSYPTVTLGTGTSSISENLGTTTITVTLSAISSQDVGVTLAFSGTAIIGTDYNNKVSTSITIPAGNISADAATGLTAIQDVNSEGDETIIIDITGVTKGNENGIQQKIVTLVDDDLPMVTLSQSATTFSEAGATNTITATLGNVFTSDVTVTIAIGDASTATGGGVDFTLSSTTITIPAGNLTGTATLTSVQDALDENDEPVIIDITDVTNGLEDGTQQVTSTILDDDPTPTVTFTASSQSSTDETGTMTITAQLSAVSSHNVTVPFSVNGSGTAIGGGKDYSFTASPITITAGNTTGTITITIVNDVLDENNETVIVDMGSPTNAAQGATLTHTATITDDDDAPSVAFNAISSSGLELVSSANLQVDLSAVSGLNVTVDYTVTGTATGGGTDYVLANGTLTINAGDVNKNITIENIDNDLLDEDNETVIITLSSPSNATLGTNTAHTYTITDNDDAPSVAFNFTSSSGLESVSSANLQVNLSAVSGLNVTVDFTVTGTATGEGTDYVLANGTLTINAGDANKNIAIAGIVDDLLDEDNETVIVTLSNPSNATLGTNTVHTYSITDNDDIPTVTTQPVSSIAATAANGNGDITDLGMPNPTQYGVVWSTSTNPTVTLTTKTAQGAIAATGAFASSITGLTANTTYYVKAYATNTAGTSYGTEVSFTTLGPDINVVGNGDSIADGNAVPSVSDHTEFGDVNIASGSVEHEFTITNSGSAQLNLTSASPYIVITGHTDDFTLTQTPSNSIEVGGGTTTFKVTFNPTTTGTRSATISIANDDANENPYDFGIQGTGITTPSVTTSTATFIGTTTSTLGGNVTSDGGVTVSGRGVVYSVSDPTPTIGEDGVTQNTNGDGTGVFSESIGSLSLATRYYYQAYAINSEGTSYGGVQEFTTQNTILTVLRTGSDPTNTGSVSWTVTLSASITGLASTNFTLANTGLTSPSITGVTGSGTSWTVTASTGAGSGSLGLNLANATGLNSGLSNSLPYTGQVYTIDKTAPQLSFSSPADNSTNTTLSGNIILAFDDNIVAGTGNVTIRKSNDGSIFEQIAIDDPKITISTNQLSIDPAGTLRKGTGYYLEIDASALKDDAGNAFEGITGNSTLNFTTVNVVINEVVTEPQTDWSTNNFNGVVGSGSITNGVDEWVELLILSDGIDLTTGWAIEVSSKSFSGNLNAGGAFDVSNYFGSGNSGSTNAGDFLILGNVTGSAYMNLNTTITLKDPSGAIVDEVTFVSPGAPSTNSNTVFDESAQRFPSGTDTGSNSDWTQGQASMGTANTGPIVTLTVSSDTIAEASASSTITATLSAKSGQDVTVNIGANVSSTAIGSVTDYSLSSTTITITAGSLTGTATVTSVQDALDENDETIVIDVLSVTNSTEAGTQQKTVTILDDDPTPTVTFTASSQSSTDETGIMTITAQLSAVSSHNVTVPFSVNGSGTATGGGTDYSITSSPITITTGNTTGTITITIVNDVLDEDDETVIVDMGPPTNAAEGATITHITTITDNDDAPSIAFNSTSSSGLESVSSANLQVELSAVSGLNVSADYTVTGTATGGGTDHALANGTLTINAGDVNKNITIADIVDDLLDESNETIIVTLSSPSNATIGTNTVHTYTITDNDEIPTVTTETVSSIAASTATGNGNVTALGSSNPTAHGVCWNTTGTPTLSDSKVDNGAKSSTGIFTASMTGLTASTTYYVRAFATNTAGTFYGTEVSFTTLGPDINVVGNGNSIADGDVDPSTADHTDFGSVATATGSIVRTFTIQNTGTESLSLTGPSPYVSISGDNVADFSVTTIPSSSITASGSTTFQITFDPSANVTRTALLSIANNDANEDPYNFSIQGKGITTPSVTTSAATSIGPTTSTLGGNVTSDGGVTVSGRGVVYSVSDPTPTIGEDGVTQNTNGDGMGVFSESIGPLSLATRYYYQAYAINSEGTSYGGVQEFTTQNTILSVLRTGSDPTNAGSVSWTVTFSASVTGLTSTNFTLANTGLTGPSITGVTGSGTSWAVTASTGAGSGSLGLNLANATGLNSGLSNSLPYTGAVYTIDKAAPLLSSSTPSDNATNATLNGNIVLDFYDNLIAGTGNVTIRNSDNSIFEQISIDDLKITISTNQLTIDPAGTLLKGTGYYLEIDASALEDDAGNAFEGITGNSTLNFTTVNVVINEVVTEPQTDWSTNGFNGTHGLGAITNGTDEWIELLILSDSIDLTTGWAIEVSSQSFSGNLNAGGAFDVSNYFGSGNSGSTNAGDFLILGNVTGSAYMNLNTTITLKDPSGAIVDEVTFVSPGAPSTNSNTVFDESAQRFPSGTDTGSNSDWIQGQASMGAAITSPSVTLTVSSDTIAEASASSTISATLSAKSGQDVTVNIGANVSSTAIGSGTDYGLSSTTITITAGSLTGTASVTSVQDALDENDENIVIDVLSVTNATEAGTQQKTVTILDDDPTPTVTFTASSQSSTDETGTMTITTQLSAVSGRNVTVPFSINGSSTATGGGTDYSITAGPITITAGSTTGTITITIVNDVLDEDDETVIVDMGSPTNAAQGTTITHTATITDDKATPAVTFTAATQSSANETGTMTIIAELSAAIEKAVTLPFTVNSSSTATAVTDYSITASPITIAAGSTTGIITITIVNDVLNENDEKIVVDMDTPTNATFGTTHTHTATITDDDETPVVTASQSFTINENSALGTIVGTVVATDSDTGTAFSNWTITDNLNPDGDENNAFSINTLTGQITVADAGDLNRETDTTLTIKVSVSDGTNTSTEESVTINLNDVNDVVPIITASQEFNVTEQSANGTTVGIVLATDGDATSTNFQNWAITAGNSDGYFIINSSSGEITVLDNTGLNSIVNPTFTLTLTVSDGTNTSSSQTVSIIVAAINDDNPLITASQSFSIDENSTNETVVGQVLATDPDYGTVFQRWTITNGNTGNAFAINSTTGVIRVNTSSVLDFEVISSFSLTIQVSDGIHTDNGIVTVSLNDLPDCISPTSAGIIGNAQQNCASFDPLEITSISLPVGNTEPLEYKWQKSVTSGTTGFSDIPDSNSATYNPPNITVTTWYKRLVQAICEIDWNTALASNVVEMTVYPEFKAGSISESQVLYYRTTPEKFTGTPPTGGTTPYTYQWQKSYDGNNFSDIPGATNLDYQAGGESRTTYFRLKQNSASVCVTVFTEKITMVVFPEFEVGSIKKDQYIAYNTIPEKLIGKEPRGGWPPYTYQWQSSTDNINFISISGANNLDYHPSVLTDTTYYRLIQSSSHNYADKATNIVTIYVYPQFAVGSISEDQTVCYNTAPDLLTGTEPTGGNLPYTYQWQQSLDGVNFTDIAGANELNYQAPAITKKNYFRQIQTSASSCGSLATDFVTITVQAQPLVDIGVDQAMICTNQSYQLSAVAQNYESVTWTSLGDGSFSDVNILNPVYTPGPNDRDSGSVTIVVNAIGISPCELLVSDQMIISFYPTPLVNAGKDLTVYEKSQIHLDATVTGTGDYTYLWSPAEMVSDPTILNPVTNPITETKSFTLWVIDIKTGCGFYDQVTLKVEPGVTYQISGTISTISLKNTLPVTNIFFTGINKTTVTNNQGEYSMVVPAGYSGWAIPSRPGYIFEPDSIAFFNVAENIVKQDLGGALFMRALASPDSIIAGQNVQLDIKLYGSIYTNVSYRWLDETSEFSVEKSPTVGPTHTTLYTVYFQDDHEKIYDTVRVYVSTTTDIVDFEADKGKVSLYPNPTKNIVHIEISGELDAAMISIIDPVGTLVGQIKLPKSINVHNLDINLDNLIKGTYYLLISDSEREIIVCKKVIRI